MKLAGAYEVFRLAAPAMSVNADEGPRSYIIRSIFEVLVQRSNRRRGRRRKLEATANDPPLRPL